MSMAAAKPSVFRRGPGRLLGAPRCPPSLPPTVSRRGRSYRHRRRTGGRCGPARTNFVERNYPVPYERRRRIGKIVSVVAHRFVTRTSRWSPVLSSCRVS